MFVELQLWSVEGGGGGGGGGVGPHARPYRQRGPLVLVCVNAVTTLYILIIPVAQHGVAKLCSPTVLHGCKL